ncbi:MAG TPA: hypothetical protein VNT51_12230, partial [Miltoncostaeaceae bacterium]|nr:hypothetical protein [Miltoncostaeaceae bacterium]
MPTPSSGRRWAAPSALVASALVAGALITAPGVARTLRADRDLGRAELGQRGHRHVTPPRTRMAALRKAERRNTVQRRRARALAASPAAAVGRWGAPQAMRVSAVNAVMLPTGRVLVIGPTPRVASEPNSSDAWTWDPETGIWRHVPPPAGPDGRPINIWCSGHTLLPDGRVLVAGGNLAYPRGDGDPDTGDGYRGLQALLTFDPFTETWTRQPDMRHGRWYPTLATLSDGRVVIVGGWDESGREVANRDVEVFTP